MGGVFKAARKIVAPIIGFKDSQGNAAPEDVNREANQGMQKIAKPLGFQDNPALENEVEAPPAITEQETLLKKKKKGRYNTLLTGEKGALGSPDIERKSLLGS
mgnify:CR=1 FL=1